jgi:asparagine synthase (glutamine-hydrolysing)
LSGIAAVIQVSETVDPQFMGSLLPVLASRGSDTNGVWCQTTMALAHSMFRTVDEVGTEQQPSTIDGKRWISADARIDARAELIAKLRNHGCQTSLQAPDAHLILHAFEVWGPHCVKHLIGDFAFVVIDSEKRQLFCARDHFGVKPLFYARLADGVMISNLLNCIRQHPQVSGKLNESFLCDFLLFGCNTDVGASAFHDIHRLPPAHFLEWTPEGMKVERYWQLSVPSPQHGRTSAECIEGFMEVFDAAVSDRLRSDHIAISLSGGLDSAAIAAAAVSILKSSNRFNALQATTAVYDKIIPDRERHFAGLVAEHLKIPIEFIAGDELETYGENWRNAESQLAEPADRGLPLHRLLNQRLGMQARVVLSGTGGDEVINPPRNYFRSLFRERHVTEAAMSYLTDFLAKPKLRLLDLYHRATRTQSKPSMRTQQEFPTWLSHQLVTEFGLRDRWNAVMNKSNREIRSDLPSGYWALSSWLYPDMLSKYDYEGTSAKFEFRFPFLDLRVIDFLWKLPITPWRYHKYILRSSFSRELPGTVLERSKQPLAGNPRLHLKNGQKFTWPEVTSMCPQVTYYLEPGGHFEREFHPYSSQQGTTPARLLEIAFWLMHINGGQTETPTNSFY